MSGVVDFDDIFVEMEDLPEGKFSKGLPLVTVPPTTMPSFSTAPYDVRESIKLVEEPEKLFDFSETTLSPVQQMYIIGYATKGTKKGACQLAGIGYGVVDKWLKDKEFAEALQNAVGVVQDSLEEELIRRAMTGSDRLLIEAIKALKPAVYQPKQTADMNINATVVHSWADLAKQASLELDGKVLIEGDIIEE